MPGVTFLGRRWNIASDDLFYPGLFELLCRSLWLIPQMVYYIEYHVHFKCDDAYMLNIYYIGFLCLMVSVLLVQLGIVIISSRGTITNIRPRRHMTKFLYLRTFLVMFEFVWSIYGTIWLAKISWSTCSKLIYFSVLANILFCFFALSFLIILLFIVFDPISHLPETDVATKQTILYDHLKKLLCCCYCCLYTGNSRKPNYENSYKQISSLLEMIFRGGDLTPSDIAAGIILLSNKETDQYNRESVANQRTKLIDLERIPKWMNITEASYFIKYAVATYSWPYYIYMHNVRGICDLCCTFNSSNNFRCRTCITCQNCCCCNSSADASSSSLVNNDFTPGGEQVMSRQPIINGDNNCHRHLKAFKYLAKIEECDLVYANFQNELFHSPFCILVDHFKKTVVITIRGTLSMRDVITDMTADCGYFDVDHLKDQPCHIGILTTAQNIYNQLKNDNLLEKAFYHNPNYKLLVTGHSLGAGAAVILSLKLRDEFPDLRCIAYSPPGGLISEALAEYTKSFILSVIIGDDIVPRLSLRSVHNLKADILKEIYQTNLPKYKIIWKYSISMVQSKNSRTVVQPMATEESENSRYNFDSASEDNSDEVEDSLNNSASSRKQILPVQNGRASQEEDGTEREEQPRKKRANQVGTSNENQAAGDTDADHEIKTVALTYKQLKVMMRRVQDTYADLQLPGNILYIYQSQVTVFSKRTLLAKILCCCRSKRSDIRYDVRWAHQKEFKKILITNRMLMDHFPNTVEDALKFFVPDRQPV